MTVQYILSCYRACLFVFLSCTQNISCTLDEIGHSMPYSVGSSTVCKDFSTGRISGLTAVEGQTVFVQYPPSQKYMYCNNGQFRSTSLAFHQNVIRDRFLSIKYSCVSMSNTRNVVCRAPERSFRAKIWCKDFGDSQNVQNWQLSQMKKRNLPPTTKGRNS